MKKIILFAIPALALAVLSPPIAEAQGTLYFSNLGQTSSGSASVGSDSWLAGSFETGTNADGYLLDSVELALADASGSPSNFTVMVYNLRSIAGVTPGSSLGTLNGSLDPVTAGVYTYSPASSLTLLPNTMYFIVTTAGTAVANGAYEWSFTSTAINGGSGGWVGTANLQSSSTGVFPYWQQLPGEYAQFAIYATPIPEPSTLGLLVLGGFLLVRCRRKARPV
jgi:hypothetical protein